MHAARQLPRTRARLVVRALPVLVAVAVIGMPLRAAQGKNKELSEARRLANREKVDDRELAVRALRKLDSNKSLVVLETLVRRTLKSITSLAHEIDKLEDAWAKQMIKAIVTMNKGSDTKALKYLRAAKKKRAEWNEAEDVMDREMRVLERVEQTFGRYRSPGAMKGIEAGAREERHFLLRQMYVASLGKSARSRSAPVVLALLKDEDPRVRALAARAARAFLLMPGTVKHVHEATQDPAWQVRLAAYETLARAPIEYAVPTLVEATQRERFQMARSVDALLLSLTGKSFDEPRAWSSWWDQNRKAVEDGSYERPDDEDVLKSTSRAAFFRVPIYSHNIVFVLDVSGSMTEKILVRDAPARERVEALGMPKTRFSFAISECVSAIEGLPDCAKFNVILYSDKARSLSKNPIKANKAGKSRARRWLLSKKAEGLTNIWDALRLAFGDHVSGSGGARRFPDLPDTIMFLTDGAATRGRLQRRDVLVQAVNDWNRSVGAIVHTVALGGDEDDALLAKLSEETHGFSVDFGKGEEGFRENRRHVPAKERLPNATLEVKEALQDLKGNKESKCEGLKRLLRLGSFAAPATKRVAKLLDAFHEVVRNHAADVLVAIGPDAVPEIIPVLSIDDHESIKSALKTLGRMEDAAGPAVPKIIGLLSYADEPQVPLQAVKTLGQIGKAAEAALPALQALDTSGNKALEAAVEAALERIQEQ